MNIMDVGAFLIGFSMPIIAILFVGIVIRLFIWLWKGFDEDN